MREDEEVGMEEGEIKMAGRGRKRRRGRKEKGKGIGERVKGGEKWVEKRRRGGGGEREVGKGGEEIGTE